MFIINLKISLRVFGTKIPPQKDDRIVNLESIDVDSYNALILPGGVKSMELLRLDNTAIKIVKNLMKKR